MKSELGQAIRPRRWSLPGSPAAAPAVSATVQEFHTEAWNPEMSPWLTVPARARNCKVDESTGAGFELNSTRKMHDAVNASYRFTDQVGDEANESILAAATNCWFRLSGALAH